MEPHNLLWRGHADITRIAEQSEGGKVVAVDPAVVTAG